MVSDPNLQFYHLKQRSIWIKIYLKRYQTVIMALTRDFYQVYSEWIKKGSLISLKIRILMTDLQSQLKNYQVPILKAALKLLHNF